jgi:hypothetical protein
MLLLPVEADLSAGPGAVRACATADGAIHSALDWLPLRDAKSTK